MNENVKVNNYSVLYFAIMSVQNVTFRAEHSAKIASTSTNTHTYTLLSANLLL
jgi:hypothetical protein